jgi:hypothetical protein
MSYDKDPVIVAIKSGNNKNIQNAILSSKPTCEDLQVYIKFAIGKSNAFVTFLLLNRIQRDRFSPAFVTSPLVTEMLNNACQVYSDSKKMPLTVSNSALQVMNVIISQIGESKNFCFSELQLQTFFKQNSIVDLNPINEQKKGRYYRAIYWAQALSLRIEADPKFNTYLSEQMTLKRVLSTFVSEMHTYLQVVTDVDLNHESAYQIRIQAIESFMDMVDKAYQNQNPALFLNTVQQSLAQARATINNDASQQSTLAKIAYYTGIHSFMGYTSSRCSNVLTNVEKAFHSVVANDNVFVDATCRQEQLKATGTNGGNTLRQRGY